MSYLLIYHGILSKEKGDRDRDRMWSGCSGLVRLDARLGQFEGPNAAIGSMKSMPCHDHPIDYPTVLVGFHWTRTVHRVNSLRASKPRRWVRSQRMSKVLHI